MKAIGKQGLKEASGNEADALEAAQDIMKNKVKVRFELEEDDKEKIVDVGFDEAIKMNLMQTR